MKWISGEVKCSCGQLALRPELDASSRPNSSSVIVYVVTLPVKQCQHGQSSQVRLPPEVSGRPAVSGPAASFLVASSASCCTGRGARRPDVPPSGKSWLGRPPVDCWSQQTVQDRVRRLLACLQRAASRADACDRRRRVPAPPLQAPAVISLSQHLGTQLH